MAAYLSYSLFLAAFVYPVVAHAGWSSTGFLSSSNTDPLFGIGLVDFSGSGVVHLTGGTTALFATYILGSRRGRFFDATTGTPLEVPKPFPGHSVSLQMLGSFILWFGWFGFNPGAALLLTDNPDQAQIGALCAVNTFLSSSAGCISACYEWVSFRTSCGMCNNVYYWSLFALPVLQMSHFSCVHVHSKIELDRCWVCYSGAMGCHCDWIYWRYPLSIRIGLIDLLTAG